MWAKETLKPKEADSCANQLLWVLYLIETNYLQEIKFHRYPTYLGHIQVLSRQFVLHW
jgi:hypothetical protein